MTAPRYELVPIYTTNADPWGFAFTPPSPGDEPVTWYWTRAGWSLELDPGTGRQVLRVPGRESALYAHEAFFASNRGHDLPDFDRSQLDD